MKQFLKNRLDNFEASFAGNGKMRVLLCSDKTPRLNFSESVHVCVFVLLYMRNFFDFQKAVSLNNYVTPVLNTKVYISIHEGTKLISNNKRYP